MTTRNSNAHFELAPQVEIERSTFDRSCNVKTSFDVGELVPFFVDEVLPGDTFQIQTSKVARLQTLIAPVMDNLFLDTYYFFVPNRIVWEHWKEFCGENNESHWYESQVTYSVPQIRFPQNGWNNHTIADYFGIPTKVGMALEEGMTPFSINALPFRAYCQIWNDWFRDQNVQDPLYFPHDETLVIGDNGSAGFENLTAYKGGLCMRANKYHDYFTSCLPAPQKGPDVGLFGDSAIAPIKTASNSSYTFVSGTQPLQWRMSYNGNTPSGTRSTGVSSGTAVAGDTVSYSANSNIYPSNLYADLNDLKKLGYNGAVVNTDMGITINDLRQAFQIQRLFEKDARGGTRYIEILKSHFGVTSPDARLQRSEYLGGNRVPLNIEQVVNTTGNENLELLPGDTSGWSQTSDVSYDVEKSFTEHGYIIGLMCARYDHTYQQGLERFWKRTDRFDFYWPALAHLGEQAVLMDEIYLDPNNYWETTGEPYVFGYQEAWAEYRYKPNYVTGSMRSNASNSLDIWHFADEYDSQTKPNLSQRWMYEDKNNIDRTLAVTSDVESQIFIDILVKNKCTRPLPLYSIPGLIDHF